MRVFKMIIFTLLKMLFCIGLIVCGGFVAINGNGLLGCLISAGGLIGLVIPLMIENDHFINEQNKKIKNDRYN
jgi:hypothetical protein